MWKRSKRNLFQKSKTSLSLFLILISVVISSLPGRAIVVSPTVSNKMANRSSNEETLPQIRKENIPALKTVDAIIDEQIIHYDVEQGVQFQLNTRQKKQMVTTSETNVSIISNVINSSFQILSTGENGSHDWQNSTEPDYGAVNISTIISENESVFRLNFTENSESLASGITNTKFIVSSNPEITSFPTIISFDYRIPFLSPGLLSSPHTLAMEFRFSNSSITFILSDFGGNLGDFLEENVTRPSGSDSLYILCNETPPLSWRHISYNITRLITTYFSSDEYSEFSSLETLFCYMIAFSSDYNLTLDLKNIEYFTLLPPYPPINYSIGETTIFTGNGSLSFISTRGNFTFTAYEASPWNNNSQTYLDINISRSKSLKGFSMVGDWNKTHIRINTRLDIPNILEDASSSVIRILLPSDWSNISIINSTNSFELTNQTQMLNEFILGKFFKIIVFGMDFGILEAWAPNYITNVEIPTDLSRNEVIQIRGELRYPLSGDINLYFHNSSFFFHQTILTMINSSFIFPEITITEQFPAGLLKLTLNWSDSYEFGKYEKLIYIHEEISQQSVILFHSSQSVKISQFQSLLINLSLVKNGNKFFSNTTLVLLFKGSECLLFSQTLDNDFILNVSHIIWDPGDYTLDIIASDGSLFFAKETVNVTVWSASIFWSFENLQTKLFKNESINFRIYSYIRLKGEEVFQILSGLRIRIWINETVISNQETSLKGFADFCFDFVYSKGMDLLQVVVEGMLEGEVLKLQTILFLISNETEPSDRNRANIHEVMRSNVKANGTFFIYYSIDYPYNDSKWYIPIEPYSSLIISGYILRDNYVIGTTVEDQMLLWLLEANQSMSDMLVVELPCPIALVSKEVISKRFRVKLETFSDITINNYTIEIDLRFFGFPFSNISLLDSLNRDITESFTISIERSIVSISQLNIINGLNIVYFLVGYLLEMKIEVRRSFQSFYTYNDSIVGSWKISAPVSYSYSILYTISGLGTWECQNTSHINFSNATSVITTFLPPQRWNDSIFVQLIVKYFTNLIVTSSLQNFTINDPFPPTLDYSLEPLIDVIRIHAFAYEPYAASGIKNISLVIGETCIAATSSSINHYVYDIQLEATESQFLRLIVFDWAGNERSSEYINVNEVILGSNSLSKLNDLQLFFPILLSFAILACVFIARIIRMRKTSIL